MSGLARQIRIGTAYRRSINLARDADALDLIRAYVPTARAVQTLGQLLEGLANEPRQRALALIGPFGVGKSALALFASALLSDPKGASRQAAIEVLGSGAPALAERFRTAPLGERGLLRVAVNGIPDSLVRQLMLALAIGVEQAGLGEPLVEEILAAAQPGIPMDQVLSLVRRVQHAWSKVGGAGLLMEIDELGKFLEYESYHPQHRDFDLAGALREAAAEQAQLPLADTLNRLAPIRPVIVRRETIESGTLRAFLPRTKSSKKPRHFGIWQATS